ncbi:MAG: hypothetical protein F4Y03_10280 [Alphaproteobacteria bacterium]|nr:hypothetical protein [Alphaproteobacteria bacterium]
MGRPHALSDPADLERVRRWRCLDGLSCREIGARIGVSYQTVYRRCRIEGWTLPDGTTRRRTTKWQPKRLAQLRLLHESGLKRAKIAQVMGVDPTTVTRGLRLLGLAPKLTEWTDRERDLVACLRAKGWSAERIANRLKRTYHSVKVHMAMVDDRAGVVRKAAPEAKPAPQPKRQAPPVQRIGGIDAMIVRRARFLAGKGWKLPDVARQVRVEPKVLEAALREFARREREEAMA